ncbi:hypothetical protein SH528x_001239 [Novipirellula sp. SH528]|uniref:hypothetical protein n=1 Tax=Novipirellula sp. SH528 TaxID=3454466 RepID=UPI003FA07CFB
MLEPSAPVYGCFPRWPENGQNFIHPNDVAIVTRRIPSERVFRRDRFDGTYYHYQYGSVRFRLRPCMWLAVQSDGIDIGDSVETVGVGMERELFVAEVYGMYFVRRKGCILYRLRRGETTIPNLYHSQSMRLLTDKTHLRPGEINHPMPKVLDRGERIPGDLV